MGGIPCRGDSSAEALLTGGSACGIEMHLVSTGENLWEKRLQRPGPVLQGLVALTLNEMGDAGGF